MGSDLFVLKLGYLKDTAISPDEHRVSLYTVSDPRSEEGAGDFHVAGPLLVEVSNISYQQSLGRQVLL